MVLSFYKNYVAMTQRAIINPLPTKPDAGGFHSEWCIVHGHLMARRKRRTIYQHRDVWESHNGVALGPDQHIHHINGDKLDNRIENLQLMTDVEHCHHHRNYDALNRTRSEAVKKAIQTRQRHDICWNRGTAAKVILTCTVCATKFSRSSRLQKRLTKHLKRPVCSRKCQGALQSREMKIRRAMESENV